MLNNQLFLTSAVTQQNHIMQKCLALAADSVAFARELQKEYIRRLYKDICSDERNVEDLSKKLVLQQEYEDSVTSLLGSLEEYKIRMCAKW